MHVRQNGLDEFAGSQAAGFTHQYIALGKGFNQETSLSACVLRRFGRAARALAPAAGKAPWMRWIPLSWPCLRLGALDDGLGSRG